MPNRSHCELPNTQVEDWLDAELKQIAQRYAGAAKLIASPSAPPRSYSPRGTELMKARRPGAAAKGKPQPG